jgi:hypothetical protein
MNHNGFSPADSAVVVAVSHNPPTIVAYNGFMIKLNVLKDGVN